MTDYRQYYQKDFVGAWSLPDGKDVTVTISRVVGGELTGQGGRKTKKPVVYMEGTDKGLALNATNGKTIAAMYGNHVEQWPGKRITLFKTTTQFGSETMECIRIRPRIPPAKGHRDDGRLSADPPPPPPERLGDEEQSGPQQPQGTDSGSQADVSQDDSIFEAAANAVIDKIKKSGSLKAMENLINVVAKQQIEALPEEFRNQVNEAADKRRKQFAA